MTETQTALPAPLTATEDGFNFSSDWEKLLRLYPPRAERAPALWTVPINNLDCPETVLCRYRHISVEA